MGNKHTAELTLELGKLNTYLGRNGVEAFEVQSQHFNLRGDKECEHHQNYIEKWFFEFPCTWSEQEKRNITTLLKMRQGARQNCKATTTYDEALEKFEQMSKVQQDEEQEEKSEAQKELTPEQKRVQKHDEDLADE